MRLDANQYIWSKWQQPLFESNTTWGHISSDNGVIENEYLALDGDDNTSWESQETTSISFIWTFAQPLKIYRIEFINGISLTKSVEIYADDEMNSLILSGSFEQKKQSELQLEPEVPFCTDKIIFKLNSDIGSLGLTHIRLIAESGVRKISFTPYLNTSEGMSYINNGFNDDSTYQTEGLDNFMFNGVAATNINVSSNHWIGFGSTSEQLKILRRDGCSTAIYRQKGEMDNGIEFLKIRFEGYTVYNNRVESNRLIYELFLLSNNDMLLNIIQTPTSSNTGTSQLVCNGITTSLTLFNGSGGGTVLSFYHQDSTGKNWNIVYGMYEEGNTCSYAYLLESENAFYTVLDGALKTVEMERLSAAIFLKYGFEEIPPSSLITSLPNLHIYLWKTGGNEEKIKAKVKAYPFSQILESTINMNHDSIKGIKLITAEYTGDVRIKQSLDNGNSFSSEIPISEWLNGDVDTLYNSLNENKILMLQFVLHDNATISRLKITYIN